jgi:hypothetical protein
MSIIRRYMDYMDRLDASRRSTPRGSSTCLALFCAAALGYVLGSCHFGRGQAAFAVLLMAMLLSNVQDLVSPRWIRVVVLPITVLVLFIIAGVMFVAHR